MNDLTRLFTDLAIQIPYIISYVAGIILSITFWRHAPKPCAFALAGNLMLLFWVFSRTLSWYGLDLVITNSRWTNETRVLASRGLNFAWILFGTAAYGLILAAIFTGRQKRQETAVENKAPPQSDLRDS